MHGVEEQRRGSVDQQKRQREVRRHVGRDEPEQREEQEVEADSVAHEGDVRRVFGDYKGEVIDAADKLNQVNAAIPALNERAKLILALNDYMPNIENALNVASNDVPEAFPKINRGVDIASTGVNAGLQGLNDAQGYLPAIQQRVESYQEVVDRAQDANQNVNQRLEDNIQTEQQSAKRSGRYSNIQTSQISNNQSDDDDNEQHDSTVSSKDVNAMQSSLSESLLSLSNYADKQAESSQENSPASLQTSRSSHRRTSRYVNGTSLRSRCSRCIFSIYSLFYWAITRRFVTTFALSGNYFMGNR